ncbi:MAG: hypothetical protein ABJN95_18470 [Maribacter sp.]|uniref:hypothetical protein n=1 Tax=Maribacter sp. TaxID=1897614 RepID=UPI003299CCC0
MKNRFKHSINYMAVLTAFTSFVLGTICLLLFKTSSDYGFVAIGYFYTLFAALINTIFLLLVLFNTMRTLKDYREHLKTILVVLLNIPIVIFYLEIL